MISNGGRNKSANLFDFALAVVVVGLFNESPEGEPDKDLLGTS
jgi:hypothetical protein